VRIGLLIYGSLDMISGGNLYDRQLVDHLRAQGDEVEIISLPWRDYSRHLMDNFSRELSGRLRNLDLDVLIQDELTHPSLYRLNHRLSKEVSFPLVAIVHHLRSSEDHPTWQNWIYRRVESQYLTSLDGFIYNSSTTRRVVESLIGIGIPCVVAFPAGDRMYPDFNSQMVASRAKEAGPLRLLFLGNVIRRKGLHTLLAALSQIPVNLWSLTVAGSMEMEPGYARRMERIVKQYRIADRVHFTGTLETAAVIEVLRGNQVLVVPSNYEGFGISYLEGMGFGLPAIASTAGGAAEIITHGVDGFLVPPADPAALNDCIHQWIENRELLVKMSLAALERYRRHPTWEQAAQSIRSFLLDLSFSWERK
jgi:glycosyltransferase involved in cell wall biosynthesis